MTMICVREGSTGHIPCVHYSQVEPIPLRPLLFSDYHQHHPILSSYQSQFIQSSHISFQFLPAGSIKIKLGWKYHHSKCLAIFTTWNISLWAFGAIQRSKDYLCALVNHLCKLSEHALVDYEQKGAVYKQFNWVCCKTKAFDRGREYFLSSWWWWWCRSVPPNMKLSAGETGNPAQSFLSKFTHMSLDYSIDVSSFNQNLFCISEPCWGIESVSFAVYLIR